MTTGDPIRAEFKADKFYRATITARADFSADLWSVRIDPGGEFHFLPGQYATLGVQADAHSSADTQSNARPIERPYSIVSSPEESDMEFFFELVPQGELTPWLYKLQPGDQLWMRKSAKGRFMLEIHDVPAENSPAAAPQPRHKHLLIATVTGVAPFVSYIRTLHRHWRQKKYPGEHKLYLLDGASRSWELAYRDEIAKIAAEVPWLTYVPTVSRPWEDKEWKHEVGRVDDLVRKYCDQWEMNAENTTAYLCGHPEMISHTRGILQRRGLPKQTIKEEIYWIPQKPAVSAGKNP